MNNKNKVNTKASEGFIIDHKEAMRDLTWEINDLKQQIKFIKKGLSTDYKDLANDYDYLLWLYCDIDEDELAEIEAMDGYDELEELIDDEFVFNA